MKIWRMGEENIVEYFLPVKFEKAAADWVGVYKVSIWTIPSFGFIMFLFFFSLIRKIFPASASTYALNRKALNQFGRITVQDVSK
jgi:hypothetical protein